jgi:TldD protein
MTIKRREFLGHVAAGSAVLTVPAFLGGCGVQQATAIVDSVPENPFMDWFGVDQGTVVQVMSELSANGAEIADLYFQYSRVSSIAFDEGAVSSANSEIEQGVGLRVVSAGQTGYAFTEDLTLPSMQTAARIAAAVASGNRIAPPQIYNPKPIGGMYATNVSWSDVGIDEKLPLLQFVDEKARALDAAVSNVALYWNDVDERVMIATLDGHLVTDRRPMTRITVVVTAQKGDEIQSGFASIAAREEVDWYSEERLTAMAQEAVDRTMILFDARQAPTGEMPIILASGASGVLLHEAIGHGLEADFNRNGQSMYADMMREKVAEPIVTIVDQATISGQRGSLNYDDEGHETGRTVLVEGGILKSYLHDGVSAQQYGVSPTGSGRRESYRFAPMPRMSCTFMEDGPHTKGEIIAAVDRGIIAETYTNGQVRIETGEFTFQIKNGWLVENGKITAPIKDTQITGKGSESLKRVTMVANDARFDSGGWTCGKNGQNVPVSQGMPTVLVSNMLVASEISA